MDQKTKERYLAIFPYYEIPFVVYAEHGYEKGLAILKELAKEDSEHKKHLESEIQRAEKFLPYKDLLIKYITAHNSPELIFSWVETNGFSNKEAYEILLELHSSLSYFNETKDRIEIEVALEDWILDVLWEKVSEEEHAAYMKRRENKSNEELPLFWNGIQVGLIKESFLECNHLDGKIELNEIEESIVFKEKMSELKLYSLYQRENLDYNKATVVLDLSSGEQFPCRIISFYGDTLLIWFEPRLPPDIDKCPF